jgi:hypothetical protein
LKLIVRLSDMNRSLILIVFAIALSVSTASAQVNQRFNSGEKKTEEKEEQKEEELKKTSRPRGSSSPIWDKLVFGGDAAIGFSNVSTFIYLAPSVGYRVSDNFVVGTGYIYQYSKINRVWNSFTGQWEQYSDPGRTIHGPKVFLNYRFLENFYAGSQFEYLNQDFGYYVPGSSEPFFDNIWTPVWFIEAGFSQRIGRKGFAVVGIRYNVLDDFQSPYASSWFPVVGVYF